MPVAHLHLLAHLGPAVLDAAHPDAADKVVVIDARAEHLEGGLGVALGALDILQNGLEQRLEVGARHVRAVAGGACPARAEDHRAVQLLIGGAKVHQQQQNLVDDLLDPRVRPVDLVHRDHQREVLLQRLLQHKAGLGHAALGGVHQQQHPVDHLEHPLHLAAEIGVAGGVDDVDLDPVIGAAAVFGQDGDAALPLDVAGIHHPLGHLLIVPESPALLEHLVHQGGLAVVDMRDDGNVS